MRLWVLLAGALLAGSPAFADPAGARTHWMRDARWGVMVHYLADWVFRDEAAARNLSTDEASALSTSESWNARVEAFDVATLAKQLASARVPYVFLTIGQGSGFYLAPNAAYDEITGLRPSRCTKRDLVSDLHDALRPRGVRLLVYCTCGPPGRDEAAARAFDGFVYGPARNVGAQRKWERVVAEWSQRWGRKVAGWWFDGCHWPNLRFRSVEPPGFESLAAAARAGNPDAVVGFNAGLTVPIVSVTPFEDFTAGVTSDPAAAVASVPRVVDGLTDGARVHMAAALGKTWGQGPPRVPAASVVDWTRALNAHGGAATWDVPVQPNGTLSDEWAAYLQAVGRGVAAPQEAR